MDKQHVPSTLGPVEYRLIEGSVLPFKPGPVIRIEQSEFEGEVYGPGCMFWCFCLTRRIVVRTPPHKSITYDAEGRVTIKGSLGAHPMLPEWPKSNWCHAYMTNGRFELCDDAICPGANTRDAADEIGEL